jgi:TonB family protein
MRRLLTALTLVAGCAFAQDKGSAPTNYAREAFDTAQEILKTRPYDFRALYATLSQLTAIQPAPTPADLDAAQNAAVAMIANLDLIFAPSGKPQDMTDAQWAAVKDEIPAFVDQMLIVVDRLRNKGSAQPVSPAIFLPAAQARKIEGQYSEEARLAGLEGSVLVSGSVGDDGSLHDLRVNQPLGLGLDERAVAAAEGWRFNPGSKQLATLEVEFALPSKHSHWHLVGAEFKTPEGASRPTFAAADYPVGSGIGFDAYDEARILSVIGRGASATVSFDIDENGNPGHFEVVNDSFDVWGPEAIRVIEGWHFHPGMKGGNPISVPCTLSLVWGPEDFASPAISNQIAVMHPPAVTEQPRMQPLADSAIVFKQEPEYTDEARRAGVEGTVPISLIVDEEGRPASLKIGEGVALGMGLEESALEAVKQWRFQPPNLNGNPTTLTLQVQVHFRLSGVESSVFFGPASAVPKPKR